TGGATLGAAPPDVPRAAIRAPSDPRGAVPEPGMWAPAPRSPSAALRHPTRMARTDQIQPDLTIRDKAHPLLTTDQQSGVFTSPHVKRSTQAGPGRRELATVSDFTTPKMRRSRPRSRVPTPSVSVDKGPSE